MYLRYREPSWDSGDVAEANPRRHSATGTSHRRRHEPGAAPRQILRPPEPVKTFPVVELHGVELHAVTEAQVITHILDELKAGRGGVVVTPNLDHLRRYCHDLNFGALVAEADLVVPDGMPLIWASRLQGTPLPERVPGSNLISSLSGAAAAHGRSIFLLGGDPGTAEGAARVLKEKFPNCMIAGVYFPPFGFQNSPKEMAAIIQLLSDSKPDIVYVALGSPKQEKLIATLRLTLPHAWWLGVGNSFSFLAGHVKRAPKWMQRIGMEWSHRLLQEPRRLFKRYLVIGLPFAFALLSRALVRGLGNRLRRLRKLNPDMPPATALLPPAARRSPQQLIDAEAALTAAPKRGRTTQIEAPAIVTPISASSLSPTLARLRGLVLLGGSVRASELIACTQRPVLDMPLDTNGSLLNHWLNHAAEVARWAGLDRLPVRVMVNQNAPEPRSGDSFHYGNFRVERDLSDYRGTGGVLHDLAGDYADDDLLLVANAAQVLLDPLCAIAAALHRKGGDVAVVSHEDGTPSGVMLVSCRTLRLIPPRGFVDMKEQALPLISSKYDVRVIHLRRPTGLPVRTLADYIQALRFHHRHKNGQLPAPDPLAEDWGPTFSLIEEGAIVHPSARVHDSVVLRGARVEAGAVVVRSVVCSGATVGQDRTEADRLVGAIKDARTRLIRPSALVSAR
jgi:N-acetylglucosaminyldiphosphoundecaprenol N-acetyl-beta-D-mannosaminyltransferase